jgi:hypothetical protein
MFVTGIIIWLAGVSWFVITLVAARNEDWGRRLKEQERKMKKVRATIKEKRDEVSANDASGKEEAPPG